MAVAARKREPAPALKTFHATVLVARAEEWCVEAETAEDARQLLTLGVGHRCHLAIVYTQKFSNPASEKRSRQVFRYTRKSTLLTSRVLKEHVIENTVRVDLRRTGPVACTMPG